MPSMNGRSIHPSRRPDLRDLDGQNSEEEGFTVNILLTDLVKS